MACEAPAVLVALTRPPGYRDVHAQLVAEDALDHHRPWSHEIVRDDGAEVIVALARPEEYAQVEAEELAREAISKQWPDWRVLNG